MNRLWTFFLDNRTVLLVFATILVVYGIICYHRQAGYRAWMENREDHVVGRVTALSTQDAYYWLNMARKLDEGLLGKGQVDPQKGYPDGVPFAIKDRPSLLAEIISLGKHFTGGDYYRSGLMLVPILAGLFVFPLFFYFNKLGFGASAVLGGLIGAFSHAYYYRTMMGAVDTDLLNVFFLLVAACFILPMNKSRTWRVNTALAIGAGLTLYLFTWWYQQPGILLIYLLVAASHLLIGRIPWKQSAFILLVFLLAAGPDYVSQSVESVRTFLRAYVSPPPTGQIVWPNVMTTITEVQSYGVMDTLLMLHGFLPVVLAGFGGLIYLYCRRFSQMLPVTPLIILGAWSLTGPIRFAMYLAPFIGIGVGVLIELLVQYVGRKFRFRPLLVPLAPISIMFLLFFSTTAFTGYAHHPQPVISAATTRALLNIKEVVPEHAAMFTPHWDYGYPLMEIGDFSTYHDGGLHGGIRTTLASKAMTSARQEEMVSMLSFLEDYGFNHLSSLLRKDDISADRMMEMVFSYPESFRGEKVYVLYLEEMLWKSQSMTYFGTWDFQKKTSDPTDYVELKCISPVDNIMRCEDGIIELDNGRMFDGVNYIPLKAVLFVNNGYLINQINYEVEDGYYLQVLMKNNKINMVLVADERLFRMNFNQQFLLGNFDRRYFEEVYNDFPVARVLKVRRAVATGQIQ